MAVRTHDWIARLGIPAPRLDDARQHAARRGLALRDALIELDLATDTALAACLAEAPACR